MLLNRQQKRAAVKKLKAKGYSTETAKLAIEHEELFHGIARFSNGDKVCLNYKHITESSDYNRKNPRYKDFVEAHKEDIFTVKRVDGKITIVELEEDTTDPKWLWHQLDLRKPDESE